LKKAPFIVIVEGACNGVLDAKGGAFILNKVGENNLIPISSDYFLFSSVGPKFLSLKYSGANTIGNKNVGEYKNDGFFLKCFNNNWNFLQWNFADNSNNFFDVDFGYLKPFESTTESGYFTITNLQ